MKNEYQFPFEELRVWQETRVWITSVYRLTQKFPKSEMFNLTSQINRAAVSVAANLAEGSGRTTAKDQAHFSSLSYSSLREAVCLFVLSRDQGFLSEIEIDQQRAVIAKLANQINALRNAQLKKINTTL